ncbi:MAG: cupin domain-containing protein [Halanaerobiaceae bacterium]
MKIKVEKPTDEKLEKLGVPSWPIWTKEISKFPWHYDQKEVCYLLEGEVEVSTKDQVVNFGAGDMVTFPEGLDCTWDVKKPVKKHYKMG